MTVIEKLNLKGQLEIIVMNAPESIERELTHVADTIIHRDFKGVSQISFSLAFVTKQSELNAIAKKIVAKAKGDAILWFAFPKGTSKNYRCDFNRDSGWRVLGEAGFEGVRLVAIDEDWSALRFRRVNFIKSMSRDPKRALSSAGKKKTRFN